MTLKQFVERLLVHLYREGAQGQTVDRPALLKELRYILTEIEYDETHGPAFEKDKL